MAIAAVIPVHNEAAAIRAVVHGVRDHLRDVFVVDDGSTDESARLAAGAGARVISLGRRRGKGAALLAGLGRAWTAGFSAAVMLDGDGQHLPEEIPRFVDAWEGGAELVLGDRSAGFARMPRLRRWANL